MQESHIVPKLASCQKHHKSSVNICTSPECFSYRQLCEDCIKDDMHHSEMHYDQRTALNVVQEKIEQLFKGLKALQKKIIQAMDKKINGNFWITQIEHIKKTINNKIDIIFTQLSKNYEKNVKQKLSQLFSIVQQARQFLQQEKIKIFKSQKLKSFYVNDLNQYLRYYQSCYQEISQKNIREFKLGFQHDKVFKLMTNFQQNLQQIFRIDINSQITLKKQHLVYSNGKNHHLYFKKNNIFDRQQINIVNKHANNNNQNWIGVIQSVYYQSKQCYYFIGNGQKQSNKIRKFVLQNNSLEDLGVKMETKRMNFAVCVFNNQIFVVGGQNSKQGCLTKCQKFVPSFGKVYIVSSLNQKSSQHTLCPYKNKFILKFGGTDIMSSILQKNNERYHPLHPQIYLAETEDWKIITILSQNQSYLGPRINFGLWPSIFSSSSKDNIIILSGEEEQKKQYKSRYDVMLNQNQRSLKEIRISISKSNIPCKNVVFSDCSYFGEDQHFYSLAMDKNRKGVFITEVIPNSISEKKDEAKA